MAVQAPPALLGAIGAHPADDPDRLLKPDDLARPTAPGSMLRQLHARRPKGKKHNQNKLSPASYNKAGHISPNDMLTLIVIGGMGTNAITGGSSSVGEILLMVGLIIAWGYVIDMLEYRFPSLRRALRDRQTPLIQDGHFLRGNMRREMITEEELMTVLRKEGVDNPSMIQSACLEADGEISLIKRDEARKGDQPERK